MHPTQLIKKRICEKTDPLFSSFWKLYELSFPVWEQRSLFQQQRILSESTYHLEVYTDRAEDFIGFLSYWSFPLFIYLEHIAVDTRQQGQGYGSRMMKDLLAGTDDLVILEADPLADEKDSKRIAFYTALGFILNEHEHLHPGYKTNDPEHRLLVLSSGRALTPEEQLSFRAAVLSTITKGNEGC